MNFIVTRVPVALLCVLCAYANGEGHHSIRQIHSVTDFAQSGISNLQERSFVGNTQYQVIQQNNRKVLRAQTNGQASALYHQVKIDLTQTPYLNWRWRVDRAMPLNNQHSKDQDDYPARIYVVFQYGIFPWQVRTLNYVWANQRPALEYWPNPFTDQAMMVPLRNAEDHLGQWVEERVNVRRDYQRIFGDNVDSALGVAIMTDADNSDGNALAFYSDLYFTD